MSSCTVYRFFDSEGALLYVGISDKPFARLQQHRHGKAWWRDVASTSLEHFDSRSAALEAEAAAIQTESPRFNVRGLPGRTYANDWMRAVSLEPRLRDVLRLAQTLKTVDRYTCPVAYWYGYPGTEYQKTATFTGGLRGMVSELVGWHLDADAGWLRTSQAYDVAYRRIYRALPNCLPKAWCGSGDDEDEDEEERYRARRFPQDDPCEAPFVQLGHRAALGSAEDEEASEPSYCLTKSWSRWLRKSRAYDIAIARSLKGSA